MLLSQRTKIRVSDTQANIIGHLCYAAYKLWNVCNYERLHYKEQGLEQFPNWYYQKKAHKDDLWYKSLPSQTAQEVCKMLDKAWKSYFTLIKTGGIENPHPPRFKHEPVCITYMQNGIAHEPGDITIRFTLPAGLKKFMNAEYGINDNWLYLENKLFRTYDTIKQIKLYPPMDRECEIIVIYEIPDVNLLTDNAKYLSIDLGLHNPMTCYSNIGNGESFIVGRKYMSICTAFNKEIARVQSVWDKYQAGHGVKCPKISKHIQGLYEKKRNSINDYLHKCTRAIVNYCVEHDIHTVILGDITNIRKNNKLGKVVNQQMHSLPYAKIRIMLQYKLALSGIRLVLQEESYTSQCSPYANEVSSEHAGKSNRKHRGLYIDRGYVFNADAVGAYNILRKYIKNTGKFITLPISGICSTRLLKVAV